MSTAVEQASSIETRGKYNLFGWRNFRCEGILSRPIFAYIILCICTFVQNFSVNGANNAVISTLERVFYMNSVQSGLFLALYDLATVFSAPLVGYLGDSYSSPIFFSFNMITVSFGNILIASSHFLQRDTRVKFSSNSTMTTLLPDSVLFQCYKDPLQGGNITDVFCSKVERLSRMSQNAKILLYFGNVVNGIGSVALFTIGVVYIERMFPRNKAAYCQGIYFAVGTVGGALGIVATGRFLLLYNTLIPKRRLPSWLTPSHPLWIGCWWLPYFIYGGLCFIIGLFVSGLPNFEVPGAKNVAQPNPTPVPITPHDGTTEEITTTATSCPPTPTSEEVLSSSTTSNGGTEGVVNHAFSTETLSNGDVSPSTMSMSPDSPRNIRENCKNLCSVCCQLMKNPRYVFIVIVNLFEGILVKGTRGLLSHRYSF